MSRPLLAEYVKAGWALVPIPFGEKGPVARDWQARERCITDPDVAEYMDGNVGLCHAYSGTCVIDFDDLEESTIWFAQRGISVDELLNAPDAVLISSGRPNRAKLLYKIEAPIQSFKFGHTEFRCASRIGTTLQDVLPPSIHPDTGKPYEWRYGDESIGDWRNLPIIPEAVLAIWKSQIKSDNKPPVPGTGLTVRKNLGLARSYITRHNPDCDYDHWVEVGMVLHHEFDGGLDGLDLWNEWSSTGTKYKGRDDLETHWRSFHRNLENPVTIASLRLDEPALDEEFEIITEAAIEAANLPAPRTPSALKEVVNTLSRDKLGRPDSVLTNLMPILSVPELCGQQLAYDSFKDVLVCAPYQTNLWRPVRDTDYTATRLWLEGAARFNPVSKDMVRDAIYYIAERNKVDTAKDWLISLAWDGVSRIKQFFPLYMGTIDTDYEQAVGEYLWTALAGRIMEPGCQVDMVPILFGPQGVGKSRGVQAIAPNPEFYAEIRLDEPDEQIARKIRGVLIAEIAELRGLKNAELERVKAFVTRTHEKWVPKYVEFATTFARRVVFVGTTNEAEFLIDTENRRWLPVTVSAVDVEAIHRDRDQLWAEAVCLWLDRGVQWRSAQELAKNNQDEFKVVDNWADLVEQWLSDHPDVKNVRVSDVMTQAVGLDARHVTRAHELRVARLLTEMGFKRSLTRIGGKVTRAWVKPLDNAKTRR